MGIIKTVIVAVVVLSLGFMAAPDCHATIYKYVDKDGLTTFADDLQSIPVQYRQQAVIVSGEAKEPQVKKPEGGVAPAAPAEPQETASAVQTIPPMQPAAEKGGNSTFGKRVMVSSMVVVSALFAFVILGIVDKDHKKSVKITRVVILWGVSVFLLYSHAMDVVDLFRSTGKSISDVQRMSEEKGKKAVKAMKELNAMVEQAERADAADPSKTDPERKE